MSCAFVASCFSSEELFRLADSIFSKDNLHVGVALQTHDSKSGIARELVYALGRRAVVLEVREHLGAIDKAGLLRPFTRERFGILVPIFNARRDRSRRPRALNECDRPWTSRA